MSTEVSKFAGNADGFAELVQMSTVWLPLAQDRERWRRFAKFGKKPCPGVAIVSTQWKCTTSMSGPSAPDMLVECSLLMVFLLMVLPGVDRWWWRRLASTGVEWWSWFRVATTERDEERERLGEHLASISLYRTWTAFDLMSSCTVLDMVGRRCITARMDVDVAAGKSAPTIWIAGDLT